MQALLGTNQTWIGAALAGSALLMVLERPTGSGLLQALSVVITKILALLFWPVLWICARHRGRWLAAALLPALGLYAAFAATGADIFYPLRFEGGLITSGNLPYVLDPLLNIAAPAKRLVFDALTLAALGGTTLWMYLRARTLSPQPRAKLMPVAIALTALVFLLFSKKSNTGYAVIFMYPLVVALGVGMHDHAAARALDFGWCSTHCWPGNPVYGSGCRRQHQLCGNGSKAGSASDGRRIRTPRPGTALLLCLARVAECVLHSTYDRGRNDVEEYKPVRNGVLFGVTRERESARLRTHRSEPRAESA